MTQYAGNPDNYPEDFYEPDDSAPPTAAEFNVAIEALADRTECIRQKGLFKLMRQVFLVDGTWTKPANMHGDTIWIEGCGGGGGGGYAAQSATNAANKYNSGGAGGGGALLIKATIDLSALAVGGVISVGIGGGGGGGSVLGEAGADGGQSYLDCTDLYPNTTFFLPGGAGGGSGRETTNADQPCTALGGPPMTGTRIVDNWQPPAGVGSVGTMLPLLQPGQGGHATTRNFVSYTTNGANSPTPAQMTGLDSGGGGGTKGTAGTIGGTTYHGGGGGGGGGGGPWGYGGAGGNGGNGNNAGAGAAGTAGTNAPANSGAGGGGGGAGGYGSAGMGANGHGGDGGSGRVVLYWWEKGVELP